MSLPQEKVKVTHNYRKVTYIVTRKVTHIVTEKYPSLCYWHCNFLLDLSQNQEDVKCYSWVNKGKTYYLTSCIPPQLEVGLLTLKFRLLLVALPVAHWVTFSKEKDTQLSCVTVSHTYQKSSLCDQLYSQASGLLVV